MNVLELILFFFFIIHTPHPKLYFNAWNSIEENLMILIRIQDLSTSLIKQRCPLLIWAVSLLICYELWVDVSNNFHVLNHLWQDYFLWQRTWTQRSRKNIQRICLTWKVSTNSDLKVTHCFHTLSQSVWWQYDRKPEYLNLALKASSTAGVFSIQLIN